VTSFAFRKQWGAEIVPGGAMFRLWAPAVDRLWLVNETNERQEMPRLDGGWFAAETDFIAPDSGYGFQLPDGTRISDPAARAQMDDVHGLSRLIDPARFAWTSAEWRGRPWEETVIYELHTGTFSPSGDFDGIRAKLHHLAALGVTALEIMPIAQFSGARGWGYDGVLPYAPHTAYGGPDALKRLIDAAHGRGLMIFLDVVYNHFGPDGNFLPLYAPGFFHKEKHTPWGPAIAFERTEVRAFFIENALYWLEEFRLDGLRFDAIDQIDNQSDEPILEEIASAIRTRITDRHIHLCTEDNRNIVSLHPYDASGGPTLFSGEWNDDFHHAAHVLLTGEEDGYYADYRDQPKHLARALAEGFIYQGEYSSYLRQRRGETAAAQPAVAFIDFLQNHDQIGNRAFGERLSALAQAAPLEALLSILLLSPHIPLLFMGEEWGETRPFLFFTDFDGELADGVRKGRREEFKDWRQFADPQRQARIPDPNAPATFEASKLDWDSLASRDGTRRFQFVQHLLALRGKHVAPFLKGAHAGTIPYCDANSFHIAWPLHGRHLHLRANLSSAPAAIAPPNEPLRIYECGENVAAEAAAGRMPPWSVLWHCESTP
jgi:malto-oligosyltrehalose trehalohydrolase